MNEQVPSKEQSDPFCVMHLKFPDGASHRLYVADLVDAEIERLQTRVAEREQWAAAWHQALETVATVLEVNSCGSPSMLVRDINEAINKLRASNEPRTVHDIGDDERPPAWMHWDGRVISHEQKQRNPSKYAAYGLALWAARTTQPPFDDPFQDRVHKWMRATFDTATVDNKIERNHRFLEESLELVQSLGCTQTEAHMLVDYVFGRPVGECEQETGGVMVTLAALANASNIRVNRAAETELARCWTKIDVIRAKQAGKPKHSPLPGPTPTKGDSQ